MILSLWQATCDRDGCGEKVTLDNPHGMIQRDFEQRLLDLGWRFLIPEAPVRVHQYCPKCIDKAKATLVGEDRIVDHVLSQ